MTLLSVFSGIGLHDEGFQRAGMRVAGQCELDSFCAAVLEQHWPGIARWSDVRDVTARSILDRIGYVPNLLCGAPPCQPASVAGRRGGATDSRWLWGEFIRVLVDARFGGFVAENVRGFLSLDDGDRVFDELEQAGYEIAPPLVFGAEHVGAPHKRHRVWIVGKLADSASVGRNRREGHPLGRNENRTATGRIESDHFSARQDSPRGLADPQHHDRREQEPGRGAEGRVAAGGAGEAVDDAERARRRPGRGDARDEAGAGRGRGQSAVTGEVADASLAGLEVRPQPEDGRGNLRHEGEAAAARGVECRWPSRPGEPQHGWEAPRLTQFGVGTPTSRRAAELDRLARRHNRESLRAAGNANPIQVAQAVGIAVLHAFRERSAA